MSVHKKPDGRYVVRWRDHDGRQRGRNFRLKKDADTFDAQMKVAIASGVRRDPHLAKATVDAMGEAWLSEQGGRAAATQASYESLWRVHVKPHWGPWKLSSITRGDVRSWIASMTERTKGPKAPFGPATVLAAHRVLHMVLEYAVDHERIPANPARKPGNLPTPEPPSRTGLTIQELLHLVRCSPPDVGDVIFTLALTGMRFGELVMLTPAAVDPVRRDIRIAASAAEIGGHIVVSPMPKGKRARVVSYPSALDPVIERAFAGKEPDAILFPAPKGGLLGLRAFRRRFDVAVEAAGLTGFTPHGLRHTYASLAIRLNVDPKVVQTQLGHATATLTLDTYGHVYEEARREASRRLDGGLAAAREQGSRGVMFTGSSLPADILAALADE